MWRWLSYMSSLSFLWTMSMVVSGTGVKEEKSPTLGPVMAESASGTPVPNRTATATVDADGHSTVSEDKRTILLALELLESGRRRLQKIDNYRATFFKHERIDGVLQPEQEMELRLRNKPLSIALHWPETGRKVVYVEGRNNNKMLVRSTGFQAFFGTLKLSPTGSLAMRECRHPIYEIGMLHLAGQIREHREYDLGILDKVTCRVERNAELDGRPCYRFRVEYSDRQSSRGYRKSIFLIDKEWSIPVSVRNYAWPSSNAATAEDVDAGTLVEYYVYRDVEFGGCDERTDFEL